MTMPRSLQMRLGVSLGILLTLLWIAAAATTAVMLRHEMDRIFDSSLQEAAQRLLPLAAVEIVGREEEGVTQHLADLRDHDEFLTYIVRDDEGRILLQSHEADPAIFPEWDGPGFHTTATHRLYGEDALQGTIRLTVAEPLAHRATTARDVWAGLGLPLLVFIPAALLAIVLTVRSGLAPLRHYRDRLAARSPRDLAPVACNDLPVEVAPVGWRSMCCWRNSSPHSRPNAPSPPTPHMNCEHRWQAQSRRPSGYRWKRKIPAPATGRRDRGLAEAAGPDRRAAAATGSGGGRAVAARSPIRSSHHRPPGCGRYREDRTEPDRTRSAGAPGNVRPRPRCVWHHLPQPGRERPAARRI